MKRFLLAGVAALALTGSATAADLMYPAPPLAPGPLYSPLYNWTGFYVGINGGGGYGGSNWDGIDSFSVSGGVVGLTGGYNFQINRFVVGIETDIDWAGIKGSTTSCLFGCDTRNAWIGTIRGRFGYAFDRFLPYLTGGVALGDIRANRTYFPGGSFTNAGWALGGGLEVAIFGSAFTAKVEYLYVGLGDFNCGLNCGLLPGSNVSYYANLLRGGINVRF